MTLRPQETPCTHCCCIVPTRSTCSHCGNPLTEAPDERTNAPTGPAQAGGSSRSLRRRGAERRRSGCGSAT